MSRLVVLIFFVLVQTFLFAQEKDSLYFSYEFINYTLKDGLPSNETYSVLQDDEGYIWISTDNGVSKYNGYEFENFTMQDGLIDNTIFKMFKDENGRIWMPGYNGKLCYYQDGEFIAYKYNHVLDSLYEHRTTSLISALYVFDNCVFINYDFSSVCIDNLGLIKENTISEFSLLNGINKLELKDKSQIFNKEKAGNVFSINDGLNVLLKGHGQTKSYPVSVNIPDKSIFAYTSILFIDDDFFDLKSIIYSIESFDKNLLIISTKDNVIEFDIESKKVLKTYLQGNSISSAFQDVSNSYWYASTNNGLYYMPNSKLSKLFEGKNSIDEIFPISYKQKEDFYFFNYYEKQNYRFDKGISKCENRVDFDKLYDDSFNFDMTHTPILCFNRNERLTEHFLSGTSSFHVADSILHFATRDAVYNYNLNSEIIKQKRVKGFLSMFNLKSEKVLIGTKSKAYVYDFNSNKVYNVFNGKVNAICLMQNNDTIIGSSGIGLVVKSNDSIVFYNEDNSNLLSNAVTDFFIEEDTLWIGTSKGLNKLYYNENNLIFLENALNSKQGLLTSRIRQVLIKNGIAFLGTDNGLYRYELSFNSNQKELKRSPILKNIEVNGMPFDNKELSNLSSNQNDIKIAYEAVLFPSQGDVRYRYKIQGLFEEWVILKEREINLYKLNPGSYEVLIEYEYSDLSWSQTLRVPFTINKPFWQEWWFVLIALLLVLLVLYNIIREYLNRNQLKLDLFKSNQTALASQMNPHFVFNAMNSLQNYMLKNESDLAQSYLVKFSRLIRMIFENSKKSFILLEQELEALNIYVDLEQKRFDKVFDYKVVNEFALEEIYVPPLVLQPFVENAIWHGLIHSEGKAELIIKILDKGDKVQFEIEDNGVGYIASKNKKAPFLDNNQESSGLTKTFERIELVGKQFDIALQTKIVDLSEESTRTGTKIIFELPKFRKEPKL